MMALERQRSWQLYPRGILGFSLTLLLASCVGNVAPGTNPGTGTGGGATGGGQVTPPGGSGGNAGNVGVGGTGGTGSGTGSGGATGTGTGGGIVMPLDCSKPQLDSSPMRRLTRREYNNIVQALLGDTSHPADQFVAESAQSGFLNGADSTALSAVVVDDFERAATTLAKTATATANLKTLIGCDPAATAGQDACATAFIKSFGARAFRRTLDDAQVADYQSLYTSIKTADGFPVAIEMVVRAMLQSPFFLYRIELGVANPNRDAYVKLTPDEVAARLALLFWGGLPDATLTQAAKDGKLNTAADVRAQANRLLMNDQGDAVFADFHVQLAQLEGLPNATKPAPFTPDIGRLLIQETQQFVSQTLRKGDGLLTTLLTSPVTYMNKDLAAYYGVTGVTSSSFVSVTMPAGQRSGFLTQGSVMANFAHGTASSPVLRGKFILSQLACSPPQPPPDNVDTTLPPPDATKSARQQLTELTGSGVCVACHSFLNPVGFAFENFDGLGKYRTSDRGLPIDSTAAIVLPADLKANYTNHQDFLTAMANSNTVRDCLASKWFIYTYGRVPTDADTCSLASAKTAFKANGNVRELLLSMTETPAFLYYRPTP